MAELPFLLTQVPDLVGHARAVSRRRRRHGPQLPGWEWPYEVFLALFRERFAEAHLPPPLIRARFDAVGRLSPDRPLVSIRAVEARLEGGGSGQAADDEASVPCLWFAPVRARPRWIFYLHGGGYVFGSPQSHAPLLARLARAARMHVLGVDYRLAPEHPAPAALNDALTAWRWLTRTRGVAARDIVVAGDSAGGGLSLALLLALRDADEPLPDRAVLLSPWTDLTLSGETIGRAPHDYLPDTEHLADFASKYFGALGPEHPHVSPLFAPDLTQLPPILSLAGAEEVLLDDARRMHVRLRDAGVAAQLHVEDHEVHVYPMFASVSRRGRDGVRRMLRFIG